MTKVALSGAGGNIGRILRPQLLERGVDLRSAGGSRPLEPLIEGEDVCHGDLRDPAVVDATIDTGYLDRQREEIERQQRQETTAIAQDFDYAQVRGLSAELAQKLAQVRPLTVGQAQRIPGMTPAAISLLLVHLERARRTRAA